MATTSPRRRAHLAAVAAAALMVVALAFQAGPAAAQTWYKTDTHIHSTVSGDGFADIGIAAMKAKREGYDAGFLTDHNGGSSFVYQSYTANRPAFGESYTGWTPQSYGTLSASTNAISTAQFKAGTRSLRLAATSGTYGETFAWRNRGPSLRAGDIILTFSVLPTRIDAGSGVYVSVGIGGDRTVDRTPSGYTTQAGVPIEGRTNVLVWQLGTPRAPLTDASNYIATQSLPYTLNAWNTYTINVSDAIRQIPSQPPGSIAGVSHIKMAAAGNGGTAEAYFDAYSLEARAPMAPADEYVTRTPLVDDFDEPGFKLFPAFEMGQTRHANRLDFAITSASEYIGYANGTDGILAVQQGGYPVQLNHPGTTISTAEATSTLGKGADFLEVQDPAWIDVWDGILKQGTQILGIWSSDTHSGVGAGRAATYVHTDALTLDALARGLYEGRTYGATNTFPGRIVFNLDPASQQPYPARYPVLIPASQATASVHLNINQGVGTGYTVRWLVNGTAIGTDSVSGQSYDSVKSINTTAASTYVRAEVRNGAGTLVGITQPIFFTDVGGLPADKSARVDRVVTATGRGYTKIGARGITASSWDAAGERLSMTVADGDGSQTRIDVASAAGPQQVTVDGQPVVGSSSAAFESATGSAWYYDATAKLLRLKVRQAGASAAVAVGFGGAAPDTPPTAPGNLTVTGRTQTTIGLRWDASSDDAGISGYDIFRDGTKIGSVSAATTTNSFTGLACGTTYTLGVEAVDTAGQRTRSTTTAATSACDGPPPTAGITLVREATAATPAAALSLTVPIAATTAGNALVAAVAVATGPTGTVGVTDSAGGTWTKGAAGSLSGSNTRVELWYRTNAPAGLTSVRVTTSTDKLTAANGSEWSGVATAGALDVASGRGNSASTTAATPSITTTNPRDLIVAAINYPSSSATATLTTSGLTALTNFKASTVNGRAAYRVTSAAGSYAASWTLSSSLPSGAAVMALKAAG